MDNENKQPDGVALLKKVIETNEATIEHYIMLMNYREDIIHMDQKIEQSLINLNATLDKSSRMLEVEEQKRQDFLLAIPKTIEAHLSEKAVGQLEQVEKKSPLFKTATYGIIGALLLSVLTTIGNIFLQSSGTPRAFAVKLKSGRIFWTKLKITVNPFIEWMTIISFTIILN